MKYMYRIISLVLVVGLLFSCNNNLEGDGANLIQNEKLLLRLNIPQEADESRTALQQEEGSADFQIIWKAGDKVKLFLEQNNKVYNLPEKVVTNIDKGGRVATLELDIQSGIDKNAPFRLIGVTGTRSWLVENKVQIDVQPMRAYTGGAFVYPLYFQCELQNAYESLDVDFMHLGTCEFITLFNKSSQAITTKDLFLNLQDGSNNSAIYERVGNSTIPYFVPKTNTVVMSDLKTTYKLGGVQTIQPNKSMTFFSWFVPKDVSLVKASLGAVINGNKVNSDSRQDFKEAKLVKGKAYRISATWTGTKLLLGTNVGEEFAKLRLSKRRVKIIRGEVLTPIETVEILSGSGSYSVESRDEDIAKATLSGSEISISSVGLGNTVVVVKDLKTNQMLSIIVKIIEEDTNNPNDKYADKVLVKGGTFQMGSKASGDEQPIHKVTVQDFYIGKYEVTNMQYADFLNAMGNQSEAGVPWLNINASWCQIVSEEGGFRPKDGKENYPVVGVTWYGAKAYAEWVGGRLPSETEWEYAARGGRRPSGYTYSGSGNIGDVAWYGSNSGSHSHQVGTKQANELGIYDMSGNVWEWCQDIYHSNYRNAPTDGSAWITGDGGKVLRGGGWNYNASGCRVANRNSYSPTYSDSNWGLRVCWGVASSGQ